jgi:hypothetical protein
MCPHSPPLSCLYAPLVSWPCAPLSSCLHPYFALILHYSIVLPTFTTIVFPTCALCVLATYTPIGLSNCLSTVLATCTHPYRIPCINLKHLAELPAPRVHAPLHIICTANLGLPTCTPCGPAYMCGIFSTGEFYIVMSTCSSRGLPTENFLALPKFMNVNAPCYPPDIGLYFVTSVPPFFLTTYDHSCLCCPAYMYPCCCTPLVLRPYMAH